MATIVVLGSLNVNAAAQVGKSAMQAYCCAKLGGAGSTAMLGRVNDDVLSRRMIANLESVGCAIEGLRRTTGAPDRFSAEDVAAEAHRLRGARYALLQLELPLPAVNAVARAARAAGLEVILDPSPAPGPLPAQLLQFVDVLTPNESEASVLAGTRPADLSVDEARSIAGELQARGVRHVIIKLGAKGCLLLEGGTATHVPAPLVKVVDATGAGDNFIAAFVVACSEGVSRLDACQFAVHAAALSVTRMGCQASVPTRAELEAYLRQS